MAVEQIIKLFYSNDTWRINYVDDESEQTIEMNQADLIYDDFRDALASLGILANEVCKKLNLKVKLLIFDQNNDLLQTTSVVSYQKHFNHSFTEKKWLNT